MSQDYFIETSSEKGEFYQNEVYAGLLLDNEEELL
jgi:hypothetical protein